MRILCSLVFWRWSAEADRACQDLHASTNLVFAVKFALFWKGLKHGHLLAAETAEIKLHAFGKGMLVCNAGAMGEGSH